MLYVPCLNLLIIICFIISEEMLVAPADSQDSIFGSPFLKIPAPDSLELTVIRWPKTYGTTAGPIPIGKFYAEGHDPDFHFAVVLLQDRLSFWGGNHVFADPLLCCKISCPPVEDQEPVSRQKAWGLVPKFLGLVLGMMRVSFQLSSVHLLRANVFISMRCQCFHHSMSNLIWESSPCSINSVLRDDMLHVYLFY